MTYSRSLDDLGHGRAHEIKNYTVKSMRMRRARRLNAYFSHSMRPKQTVQVTCVDFIVCLLAYSEPMDIATTVALAQSPVPTYDIADLSDAHINLLHDTLSLRFLSGGVDFFGSAPEPVNASLPGFAWHPEVDEANRRYKCTAFVQDILLAGLGNGQIDLEDARASSAVCFLRGQADFAIVDSNAWTQHKDLLAGLRMVVMVRKDIQPQHDAQIIGQLASVGMKAPCSNAAVPMVFLTYLNHQWHFYWLEDPRVLNYVLYKGPGMPRGSSWTACCPCQPMTSS